MLLDEIHENEILQMFKNGKLFKRSIRLVMLRFRLYVSNTGLVELLYICIEAWPKVSVVNEFQYFVLAKVAS